MIEVLEGLLGREARKRFLSKQPGDVDETYADVSDLGAAVGFRPRVSIEEGLSRFVDWYRAYYAGASSAGELVAAEGTR